MIGTFPTFMYSVVNGLKIGKGALECAICLNEFEDVDNLILIPKCDHVFHPECIDAWLNSHVTCPVGRADLIPQPGETLQIPDFNLQIDVPEETQNPQNPVDEHLIFRFHQLGHPNQHSSQSGCEREPLLPSCVCALCVLCVYQCCSHYCVCVRVSVCVCYAMGVSYREKTKLGLVCSVLCVCCVNLGQLEIRSCYNLESLSLGALDENNNNINRLTSLQDLCTCICISTQLQGFVVVETNFRMYSYSLSKLHCEIFCLFSSHSESSRK
ncbi:RING-H2 finger protein ATL11 [Camellia lanceoleosa]|uniref:RING-H2 finger protein ATL11 n=1 Tax=Camellia lanceoleosa TaxID=1840588 RepID=A0ACC0IJN8_9ERIC|nr:RING-H2 finger protein ATL11 [Camellia lanceoleosa]